MRYAVTLYGENSEGAPIEMKWGTDLSAIEAAQSVTQILSHKEEGLMMIGTNRRVFNGQIAVDEIGA